MSAGEGRTVAELLDDSDGLAREALLDMSADRALGMVRGWPQLMQSAAELLAVLPADPTASANSDSIAILAAMGKAVARSLAAGHWPGRGPRDEAWEQIASNFVQARRLPQEQPVASEAVSTDGPIEPTTARTQIVHALYVAAHATTVALTGYQRELQHRLEVGAQRPQLLVERPTALEVESAGGMITRFDAVEELAADSMAARWFNAGDQPATGRGRPVMRLGAALAAREIQAHRTLASHPDAADLVRVARVQALIATTTVVVSQAATRRGEIDAGVVERLTPALENAQLAWSRLAHRWAELTTPASRTDPALAEAAGQLRAAIGATVANQTGWATPEQIASRIDLPTTAMTLHHSMGAHLDSRTPIGNLLRKVIALGGKADSAELRDWANRELKGYGPDDELLRTARSHHRCIPTPAPCMASSRANDQPNGPSGLRTGRDHERCKPAPERRPNRGNGAALRAR